MGAELGWGEDLHLSFAAESGNSNPELAHSFVQDQNGFGLLSGRTMDSTSSSSVGVIDEAGTGDRINRRRMGFVVRH